MPRISRLTIQGFRSFGKDPQSLDLDTSLAAVWGPNSEGKTSVAEAVEFLLTGDIARRKLLASAVDEFADSLCNAHVPEGTPTFVEIGLEANDGSPHTLMRTIVCDFTRRDFCTSTLMLDGAPVTKEALASVGIVLSEPPLSAPVLMQHTLGYLFSAKPQERSVYFKSLLEVLELDDVRTALRDLSDGVSPPTDPRLTQLDTCLGVTSIASNLTSLLDEIPSVEDIRVAVAVAAEALLAGSGETPAVDRSERLAQLDSVVALRRAKTFPLSGFERGAEVLVWSALDTHVWDDIDAHIAKLAEVDEETQRLTSLFEMVLALPAVEGASGSITCPVCETPGALTLERVQAIREVVARNAGLHASEGKAQAALRSLDASALALADELDKCLPRFLTWDRTLRRSKGFLINRLAPLLEEADRPLLRPWFHATAMLLRRRHALSKLVANARSLVAEAQDDMRTLSNTSLRSAFDLLPAAKRSAADEISAYTDIAPSLVDAVRVAVDRRSNSTAWAELAELGRKPSQLRVALVERRAHEILKAELSRACREVDQAKEAVLEDKFNALAADVKTWWELLRPGEPAFFSGLGLRSGGQRNIDFKAGLASSTERRDWKIRDAIAVFSQSQLHCLGLATFLARSAISGGFIVLDDPIISIDDDYSVHFINAVLDELRTRGVQVILLTYEQKTWRAIQGRYGDGQCEAFQLNLDDPRVGTVVRKSSDALSVKLKAAEPFTRSNDLSTRKEGSQRIRDCGERLCKDLLVKKRREGGDSAALTTDYSGTSGTLGYLVGEVTPHLESPDEPGKLRLLEQRTNPGNHDDDVPPKTTLAVCLGDLTAMKRKYL